MAIESLFLFLFILDLLQSPVCSLCPLPPLIAAAVGNTGHDRKDGYYIEYTCSKGYYIGDGDSRLKCSNGTINGNLPKCLKKRCQSLSPGARVHITSERREFGSWVWVSCEQGYRMTSTNSVKLKLTCVDGHDKKGRWSSSMPDCSLITCSSCITLSNGQSNCDSSLTYNYSSTVEYWCNSGYNPQGNNVLTCGDQGSWKSDGDRFRMTCSESKTYTGCYTMENPTSNSTRKNDCQVHCQTNGYHYAGFNNAGCACRNTLTTQAIDKCNERCNIDGKVTCGGTGNIRTSHYSFYGCYEDSSVPTVKVELPSDSIITCIEYCRLRATTYALLLHSDQCSCTNDVSRTAKQVSPSRCQFRNSTDVYFVRIVELEKTYLSCNALYNAGVRYHGEYILGPNRNVTRCNFKDGTPCDHGWIGYGGACYHFNPEKRTFLDSLKYCTALNSDLVSIHNRNEANFLKKTITEFEDLKVQNNWVIGLYDKNRWSNYIWSDGTLKVFLDFVQDHPSGYNWQCVFLTKDGWKDIQCWQVGGLICKKKEDSNQCLELTDPTNQSFYSAEDIHMNPGLCFQTCRGMAMKVSAVNNVTCYCYPNMPPHKVLNWTECNHYCNSHTHQNCGGGQNVSFVTKESGQPKAISCYELQLQGMANPFTANSTGAALCTGNDTNSCPRTWLAYKNSCYKFFESRVVYTEAVKQCMKNDAYVVTINDADEESHLFEMIQKISVYKTIPRWWIGLTNVQKLGVFRWSDGQMLSYNKVNDTVHEYVSWIPSTKTWRTFNSHGAFICEKDPVFSGCYRNPSQTGVVAANIDMTVNMCVELCRGRQEKFALLDTYRCYCSNNLTNEASCVNTHTCKAQPNQLCGAFPVFAAYQVDQFKKFTNSCEDLLFDGISIPTVYELEDGLKNCTFQGNVDICPDDTRPWIGFNDECYLLVNETKTWEQAQNVCLSIGSTLASIRDDIQLEFLTKLIKPRYSLTRDKTVWLGGSDEIYEGFYNWVDGNLLSNNQSKSIGNSGGHHLALLKPNYKLTKTKEGLGYILCQVTKDYRGCFKSPSTLPPSITVLVTSRKLVSVNLCKQLCLGSNYNYSLTHQKSCACTNTINSLTKVEDRKCQKPCPSINVLACGFRDKWTVHQLDDSGLVTDCSQLAINGIFLNATYKLWNRTTNSSELKQCGQADNSKCPIGWVGKDGICYYFSTQKATLSEARNKCFSKSSILSFPTNSVAKRFTLDMVNSVPAIWSSGNFFVGVQTFNRGSYVVAATGKIIKTEADIPTHFNQLALTTSNTYVEMGGQESNQFFICEKFSGYKGCTTLSSQQQQIGITGQTMTATKCLEFCRGQEFTLAAVNITSCFCLESDYVLNWQDDSSTEWCNQPCPGFDNQPCGGDNAYSVYEADSNSSLPDNCDELAKLGVTDKSTYKIQPNNKEPGLKTTCFATGGYADSIQPSNYTFTSKQASFSTKDLRVDIFPTMSSAWEPTSTNGQWVEVTFPSLYVVTGIRTRGVLKPHPRWVKSYELFYGDMSPGYLAPYSENNITEFQANSDGKSVVTRHFRKPFVASTVRLIVKESYVSIALGFEFLGQPYQSTLASNSSIGCFAVDNSTSILLANVSTKSDCKETCLVKGYPIYGIQEKEGSFVCKCVWGFGKYGQLDDTECHNESIVSPLILDRTFEISCQAPPAFDWASMISLSSPAGGKYAYNTKVRYTCIPGYEFPDQNNSSIVKCQQNNQWESLPGNCTKKRCPSIPKVDGTTPNTNETIFGSKVTYQCQTGFMFPNSQKDITIECLADGTWNDTVSSCVGLKCGDPPTPGNSRLDERNDTHATFVCNEGYFSDGFTQKTLSCQQNVMWEFNNDECKVPNPFRQQKTVTQGERNKRIADPYQSLHVRGLLDCISNCMQHMSCSIISLHTQSVNGSVNCDLFLGPRPKITLADAPGWNMYYME